MATKQTKNVNLAMAQRIVCWQLLVCLIIYCALLWFWPHQANSFFFGGALVSILNLGFAYYFFTRAFQRSAGQIIMLFYVGEVLKMLVCGVVALFFIKWCHLGIEMFIVGMVVAYICFWVLAPLSMRQQFRESSAV